MKITAFAAALLLCTICIDAAIAQTPDAEFCAELRYFAETTKDVLDSGGQPSDIKTFINSGALAQRYPGLTKAVMVDAVEGLASMPQVDAGQAGLIAQTLHGCKRASIEP